MKAIIPVAGIGSRLRPHTHTQPKALVPVAGKPILAHIVDSLIKEGVEDFIFVIGYFGDKVQSFVEHNYADKRISFEVQSIKEGIGHAIFMANSQIVEGDELLIVLGDTIFNVDFGAVLELSCSCFGVKKVEDPRDFGVVELDEDGYVKKAVEKPLIPKSNLAMVGLYKFKEGRALMDALKYNIDNDVRTHNQFQLTDGIMRMIENGTKFRTFAVEDWYDCGRKDILLETNAMLLNKMQIQPMPEFENTIIIQPVSIPKNCTISNSIIGPNVSIGENTQVSNSIVRNSIIGSFSSLDNVVLFDSLVGGDAILKGLSQRLNLGDSTEISFS